VQGRWSRYEVELAAASAQQQALSMEQGKASKQQIFSRYAIALLYWFWAGHLFCYA
jgi:hypothetical protein